MARLISLVVDGVETQFDLDAEAYKGLTAATTDAGVVILDRSTDYGLPKVNNHEAKHPGLGVSAEADIEKYMQLMSQ